MGGRRQKEARLGLEKAWGASGENGVAHEEGPVAASQGRGGRARVSVRTKGRKPHAPYRRSGRNFIRLKNLKTIQIYIINR